MGLRGFGNLGVIGECDSDGIWGVLGGAFSTNPTTQQYGVFSLANHGSNISMNAYHQYLHGFNYPTGRSLRVECYYSYAGTLAEIRATNSYAPNGLLIHMANEIGSYTGTGYGNFMILRKNNTNYIRFDLYGRGYFNGGAYAGGADFAESVEVDRPSSEFEPGDVVVIDAGASRRFALSTESSSSLVAGVVSTKAALVGHPYPVASMSREEKEHRRETEIKLGIVGIVPTKVCDEGGAIRSGDLLVTASVPGHARKAPRNPAPGTVLGKALAPHEKGRGKIEVLLVSR